MCNLDAQPLVRLTGCRQKPQVPDILVVDWGGRNSSEKQFDPVVVPKMQFFGYLNFQGLCNVILKLRLERIMFVWYLLWESIP